MDISSVQAALASLRTDVDAILVVPSVKPQVVPTALVDDTVLDALFSGTVEEGLAPTHAKGKRHHSNDNNSSSWREPPASLHRWQQLQSAQTAAAANGEEAATAGEKVEPAPPRFSSLSGENQRPCELDNDMVSYDLSLQMDDNMTTEIGNA
ncbi:hypothetical protein H5410_020839 [Solanum commersonii]|uniref:Integrase core domain containing protein n=1 Tax=Solanum commersonii TaxID=4109 RepID=A0A9J5ZFF2_SOLCO|nr:hypothetical protein H5410_020839 [Solanum commersonii]